MPASPSCDHAKTIANVHEPLRFVQTNEVKDLILPKMHKKIYPYFWFLHVKCALF